MTKHLQSLLASVFLPLCVVSCTSEMSVPSSPQSSNPSQRAGAPGFVSSRCKRPLDHAARSPVARAAAQRCRLYAESNRQCASPHPRVLYSGFFNW